MRIALHRHPGIPGVGKAAEEILRAVPGIELVDLGQPAVGLTATYSRALPEYRNQLYRALLDAARGAGVDALVAVYHADHRDLCAHEGEYPFRIVNLLEIVGENLVRTFINTRIDEFATEPIGGGSGAFTAGAGFSLIQLA